MLIKNPQEVPPKPVDMEGAQDVKMQVLFGPRDQAPTFAMRVFEMAPSGHTPYHDHPFEHEVMIMEGDIAIVSPVGETPVEVGDVALIQPGEIHQFKNLSDVKPAKFMCLIPIAYQP